MRLWIDRSEQFIFTTLTIASDMLDLSKNLANASEETVRAFLQSLKDSKSLAAEDLQENVFKNYNEFVTISKEISKLESDMQTLRGLLDDLKTSSDNLVDDDDEFLLTAGMFAVYSGCGDNLFLLLNSSIVLLTLSNF